MSLNRLSRVEKEELLHFGLDESGFVFVEDLIAKKQVVLLEEMLARGKDSSRLRAAIVNEQQNLMRAVKELVLTIVPFQVGQFKSSYIKTAWRRNKTHVIETEAL